MSHRSQGVCVVTFYYPISCDLAAVDIKERQAKDLYFRLRFLALDSDPESSELRFPGDFGDLRISGSITLMSTPGTALPTKGCERPGSETGGWFPTALGGSVYGVP